MHSLRQLLLILVVAFGCLGASRRTPNFIVEAPNAQVAQQVGEYAERYRKEKALQWINREMPQWNQPLPIRVTVTMNGAGGATTFGFDHGQILSQEMEIQGPLDRLLDSVLPHEVTHTVFAHHFRGPLPRWADEGGCVLSEDDTERHKHDEMIRHILAGGRGFRLRVLMDMRQYPDARSDVMTLYAEGYSLVRFLVESSSRPAFLNFLADGLRMGWDKALQTHYRVNSVEELEEAWLNWLRGGNVTPLNGAVAKTTKPSQPAAQPVARLKSPQTPELVRGASPEEEEPVVPVRAPVPPPANVQRDGWSPVYTNSPPPPRAYLMPPQQ